MKRLFLILSILCMLGLSAEAEEFRILTTFYPMYILTQNVAGGIDGVTVSNMAEQTVGCLHDYTLQTRDMVMLEEADALVINGGGMEQVMDRVASTQAGLPVIDASQGIEMQASIEEGLLNAHVWLDPQMAIVQVKNIAEGLAGADPAHADRYREQAEAYIGRLRDLDAEMAEALTPLAGKEIITFHEAFNYLAQRYGLVVAGVIANEPGEEPSTRQIAETCDLVSRLGIGTLFTEPQYPQTAAKIISGETGASIYVLDPCVSGSGLPESYEQIQRENARILREALLSD
ncbi:MAG: zinc ABC transporter substrate-binding protein [Clostridia bacterium]|nr:zinc ABC transporter substrate-binding protein [Clostridia bacterium]